MSISKTILIIISLLVCQTAFSKKIDDSKLKIYTVKELVKHNSKKSCWTLLGKYIYDVTKFLNDHPGSYKILYKCCAKDCSKGYDDKGIDEPHTNKSHKMRDKMIIGILKEKM